jgi:hypothetical protein
VRKRCVCEAAVLLFKLTPETFRSSAPQVASLQIYYCPTFQKETRGHDVDHLAPSFRGQHCNR